MKKIIHKIALVLEALISLCLVPVFNLKIFHEVSIREGFNDAGEIVLKRTDHYYSIIDNLKYSSMNLVNISIALLVTALVSSLAALVYNTKKSNRISHTVFTVSIIFFLIVLLLASSVHRDY